MPHSPHPANVHGDFYVEVGCCVTCGVPLDEAPEVFAWAGQPEHSHCVVVHQPRTAWSVDRTLNAMASSEVDCIRYRGADRDILRRIAEMGSRDQCDYQPAIAAAPLTRSHASFTVSHVAAFATAQDLALHFLQHTVDGSNRHKGRMTRSLLRNDTRARVRISWFRNVYHTAAFERLADDRWHIVARPSHPGAGKGLSRLVERWLVAEPRFQNIRWFSEAQWRTNAPGQPTVF